MSASSQLFIYIVEATITNNIIEVEITQSIEQL